MQTAPSDRREPAAPPDRARTARMAPLRRWLAEDGFGVLLAEWMLCNVGQWAVVSILSLYLLTTLRLAPAVAAGVLLFATLSFRLTRFIVAPVLDRLQPRSALLLSLGAAAAAYVLLAVFPLPVPLVVLVLPLVGAGYGSNALLVKALAAGREEGRLVCYGAVNSSLNAGAALGPLLGTWLFLHLGAQATFAMATACFAAAALIVLRLPRRNRAEVTTVSWMASLRSCLGIAGVRRALVFTGLLFFLYSQLYAILPLAATSLFGAPDLLGTYFALNAVLVIGAQIPISRLASARAAPPPRLVQLGYASFAAGFLAIWLAPAWQVSFLAVVCWSLAEMLILPGIDAIMAGALPDRLRISGFSLLAVAVALGEGGGAFVGVAVGGQLAVEHELQAWYGVLAACALAAAGVGLWIGGSSAGRADVPGKAKG